MKEFKNNHALLTAGLLIAVVVVGLLLPGFRRRGQGSYINYLPAPSMAEAAEVNSWTQAVQKVKEDRGEPVGKQAKVDTPPELRHYSDTRRFLAVQYAEWRAHQFKTPKDFVDLAAMLRSGEMVGLKPVTQNYILLGVGGLADTGPFTRYENGRRIPLYEETALAQQSARFVETRARLENEIVSLRQELEALRKSERSKRSMLQARIAENEKKLRAELEDEALLERDYSDTERRQRLMQDYESLESLAKSFSGSAYNIEEGRSRREMKVRMLSSLRPEALKVMEEVALAYRQKFNRPLPLTSLVRPDEYQHALSKVNPNATRIETPPHSTGLAFDIYNRYMTAEEQSFVMEYLARLKDEGRIEVLRENRDHYHVFAFIDGVRPDEALISASLSKTKAPKAAKESDQGE
ncbi:MAG TPA: DUF5715 family protein [Pyrinomonadaceae bacterium]|nr:DUF5715 family protein [Pyrinomonadaceae bacterium]